MSAEKLITPRTRATMLLYTDAVTLSGRNKNWYSLEAGGQHNNMNMIIRNMESGVEIGDIFKISQLRSKQGKLHARPSLNQTFVQSSFR